MFTSNNYGSTTLMSDFFCFLHLSCQSLPFIFTATGESVLFIASHLDHGNFCFTSFSTSPSS